MGQQQSKGAVSTSKDPTERLYFLDNFRTFLTALVIYHHTAIPYGGVGSALYTSSFHTPSSSPTLIGFNMINQSYFMGSFFFLSGYLSSRTLQRKGPKTLLRTKALKLGVPVIVYTLLGTPTIVALMRLWNGQPLESNIFTSYWRTLRGVRGHVWYAATLLLFDTLETIRPYRHTSYTDHVIIFNLGLDAVSSFLIRLVYPVGAFFEPLRLQPAYLLQYVSAYLLGASLESAPAPALSRNMCHALLGMSVASAAVGLGFLVYLPDKYTVDSFWGGLNAASLCYSIWNETTGYLLGALGLQFFRESKLLRKSWGRIGSYSYAAFLVHMIVISIMQTMTDGWVANGVIKTAVIGTVGVLGSWGVGMGLVKLPFVGRVVG